MAAALLGAASLDDADSILAARGISTELAFERRTALQ
jgi:hypothetical protein